MLTEGSKVGTPLVGMNFAVWAFKEREESNLPHGWAVGVRLGSALDGARTQSLKTPPPASRGSPPADGFCLFRPCWGKLDISPR